MFVIFDFVDKDGGLVFKVGSELFFGYVDCFGICLVFYLVCVYWIVMVCFYLMKVVELCEVLVCFY